MELLPQNSQGFVETRNFIRYLIALFIKSELFAPKLAPQKTNLIFLHLKSTMQSIDLTGEGLLLLLQSWGQFAQIGSLISFFQFLIFEYSQSFCCFCESALFFLECPFEFFEGGLQDREVLVSDIHIVGVLALHAPEVLSIFISVDLEQGQGFLEFANMALQAVAIIHLPTEQFVVMSYAFIRLCQFPPQQLIHHLVFSLHSLQLLNETRVTQDSPKPISQFLTRVFQLPLELLVPLSGSYALIICLLAYLLHFNESLLSRRKLLLKRGLDREEWGDTLLQIVALQVQIVVLVSTLSQQTLFSLVPVLQLVEIVIHCNHLCILFLNSESQCLKGVGLVLDDILSVALLFGVSTSGFLHVHHLLPYHLQLQFLSVHLHANVRELQLQFLIYYALGNQVFMQSAKLQLLILQAVYFHTQVEFELLIFRLDFVVGAVNRIYFLLEFQPQRHLSVEVVLSQLESGVSNQEISLDILIFFAEFFQFLVFFLEE